jgi:hypothetical protein
MALVNGRYAVVDLASGEVREAELPDGYATSGTMMFGHVDAILEESSDAIAMGSGLATASLIPAACAGFIRRPGDGASHEKTCLLTGGVGAELKLSGFDLIVLENAAAGPGYLWVRDGIAEFVPSPEMKAMDSWSRTDSIRTDQGDRKIQVVSVGPWGDEGLVSSQLVTNYWGGEDKMGFAAEFGRRNLLATAFRGMGEIELDDPEGHFARSKEIRARHLASLGRSSGLASFSDIAKGQGFLELRHREVACFGCPFPCRTFYKVAEDPRTMKLESREPGYLAYDIPAVERLSALGLSPRDTVSALIDCAKSGAEPIAVGDSIESEGQEVTLDAVRSLLRTRGQTQRVSRFLPGSFTSSFDDPAMLMDCVALGLCPRYWARVGFETESLSAALGSMSDCR